MNKPTLKQIIREELEKSQYIINRAKQSHIRGIKKAIKDYPKVQNFVGKELIRLGKERLEDLDINDLINLNISTWKEAKKDLPSSPKIDPNQKTFNPYDLGKGKGYMGATYTGD
jgi:hypothetical protein